MLKKLLLFHFFLLGFFFGATSQEKQNNFQKTFNSYYNVSSTPIDTTIQNKDYLDLNNFINYLKKETGRKNVKKDLKFIFAKVHSKYFTKYVDNPDFKSIFTTGDFNCLTASILYTLVFDQLNIPYSIRLKPTHIYVIAYPKNLNIIVESTLPENGLMEYREKEIQNYKEELIANKVITEGEYNEEKFWESYIFADSIINQTQLNGIQHYNLALYLLEKEEYLKSLDQTYLAKQKYNSPIVDEFYIASLYNYIEFGNYESSKITCNLIVHALKINSEVSSLYINSLDIFRDLIIEKPIVEEPDSIQYVLNCFIDLVKDSTLKHTIINAFDITTAESYKSQAKIDSALLYLVRSYDVENKNSYSLIEQVLLEYLISINNPVKIIPELVKYESIFEFVKFSKKIQSIGIYAYMNSIYTEFELNAFEKANSLLNEFRNRYKPNDNFGYNPDIIGLGFGAASAYQVRQNNYKKAISIIEEGLSYTPSSLELRRKLNLLEEDDNR